MPEFRACKNAGYRELFRPLKIRPLNPSDQNPGTPVFFQT